MASGSSSGSSGMQNIFNNVKSQSLKVAEYFTPVLKESKFRETGVLTPDEFVCAGDHLVHHCPSWQWAKGDPNSAKDYLPADKQFLVTRNVPCYARCKTLMAGAGLEEAVLEDGWVDTHGVGEGDQLGKKVDEMTLDGDKADKVESKEESDSDQEAVDMEDFADSGMLEAAEAEDKSAVVASKDEEDVKGGEIVETRTYDLNVVYDKFYQTPRLFLNGYDEKRRPLTVDQMYEDFSADHANKTITMETHPHLPSGSPAQASVHPCKHAAMMKKMLERMSEGGGELGVHMYLIVFLKFIQAVIPTIEYDFTQNFAIGK